MFILKVMHNFYNFFRFPQDLNKKNKWLKALNLKDWCPPKSAAVCSAHFRKEDYESHLECKRLKKDAIPFVNILLFLVYKIQDIFRIFILYLISNL